MDQETREELQKIEGFLGDLNTKMETILGAFPVDKDGNVDTRGHRDYHEASIRAARAQEKFWIELRRDLAKKGIWALIIIVTGLIVTGVSAKFGFPKL